MFTQNFLNYQKGVFMGTDYNLTRFDGTVLTYEDGLSPAWAGIGYALGNGNCRTLSASASSYSNSGGVFFGTDPTPPTKNDITLPGLITSGLTIENMGSLVGKEAEGKYAAWSSYVVKNTSSTVKNIYEIGIFAPVKSGNYYAPILMERTVLPEPIYIQAGEQTIITHKITFNQVLNVE